MATNMFDTKFEEELYNKQIELEMNNTEFAKYINKHRSWLVNLNNKNLPKHKLSKKTMAILHNRLGISFDTMNDYNKYIDDDGDKIGR